MAKADGADPKHQGSAKGCAFLVKHLVKAQRPSDVLRAAIKGISDGQKSRCVETLYLYQSLGALESALALAEAREKDQATKADSGQAPRLL